MLFRMMKTVFRLAVSVKWPLSILSTPHSVAIPRKKPRNAVLFLCLLASAEVFAAEPLNQSVHSGLTDPEVVAQVAIEEPSYQVVDVGVLAIRGYKATINRWQPLMGWLETQIPNSYFRLHPLTLDELAKGVETQGLDFVITNPGQSVLLARQYSLTWLATLRSPLNNGAAMQVGSALVVRADSPYHTLSDLKGRRLGIVSKNAFGGYLTLVYEAQLKGIDLPRFVGEIIPLGFPLDNLIYQLDDKKTSTERHQPLDAAVVPVCQLEQMQTEGLINIAHYRVLDNQAPAGFNCQVSTHLYPNWSMAKTNRASQSLAKSVTQALLALPEDHLAAKSADSAGWTTAVSQLAIDQLLKDLDMHPLQAPWWQRAWQWIKLHQQWAWLVLGILVLLNVYHFWLEYRFSRRGRELINTQRQLNENRALLEHAQRIAIAGELGASLSHELNQPLAAIGHYCHGAEVRLQRGTSPEELQSVLALIQQEVTRADNIISRLRNLLKKRPVSKQPLYLHELVNDTVPLLAYEFEQHQINLAVNVNGEPYLQSLDEVGMQQLLLNLLKNAFDACVQRLELEPSGTEQIITQKPYTPTIDIDLRYQERILLLTVTDNGTGLTEAASLLMQAFYSTKSEGLGLGLVICRDIAESHGGTFSLESAMGGGCQAQVAIPRKPEPNGAL
ncbi:sensor histidine kinase [Shewanella putrefaciens]|uniref:histidine kinase n=2 Tax=Shewanella putrefaciens TaxID=24 RepID=A0ABX8XHA5_SHEPU|nr:PhnD/SsuA/transferrin family substrate-binding protein [Shewanella putrefaciens]MCT8943590.1 PhnD/SsuA/transferrin family substrate-binding protein [Shewanella putrefaciens]QSE51274.1 PhnD/SsuA/transferrin family substrate-binding protein [Shewanella putrefaciens]QYX74684.1 PhnD/SsuA/transferrin family substrate-binding protein [Shewanella putrefaciens]